MELTMKSMLFAAVLALGLPAAALAADSASGSAPVSTTGAAEARTVTLSDAKRAVRDLLRTAEETRLVVGEATRKGDVFKVQVTNLDGIPVKSFKVDANTGEVIG
jgi:opacity protein-like surface antigen